MQARQIVKMRIRKNVQIRVRVHKFCQLYFILISGTDSMLEIHDPSAMPSKLISQNIGAILNNTVASTSTYRELRV